MNGIFSAGKSGLINSCGMAANELIIPRAQVPRDRDVRRWSDEQTA